MSPLFSDLGVAAKKGNVSEVKAVLEPDAVLMEEAEVVGSRIDERQKQGPLTVESMDVLAIKEAPSGNFYEGLGNLKGVDMTSASLGSRSGSGCLERRLGCRRRLSSCRPVAAR